VQKADLIKIFIVFIYFIIRYSFLRSGWKFSLDNDIVLSMILLQNNFVLWPLQS